MDKMIAFSDEEYYYKLDSMIQGSCHHLRQVFKNRWASETGNEWTDDEKQGNLFQEYIRQNISEIAQSVQIDTLKSKSINDWDITLLSLVIKNLGNRSTYRQENSAVNKLKDLRNYLAHSTANKLPKEEYLKRQKNFIASLKHLGVEEDEIKKVVDQAGISSSLEALKTLKGLFSKAKKHSKNKRFKQAEKLYAEAVQTPSLLPVDLGVAYEKYYLNFKIKNAFTDKDTIGLALLDLNKALELNENSWNAHFLLGKCHRWNNDPFKAIHHFQWALAISPAQKNVKDELDSCKLIALSLNRKDHLNPEILLQTTTDLATDMTERSFGFHAGAGDLKLQRRAAHLKNPTAMYDLAVCYHEGKGMKADLNKAARLFKELAELDPRTPGEMNESNCNDDVAAGQSALGGCYFDGTGVERDLEKAAFWFEKVMENGSVSAAVNLGTMYFRGKGVSKYDKMAEMCWKYAMNIYRPVTSESLVHLYLSQLEPDKARAMFTFTIFPGRV